MNTRPGTALQLIPGRQTGFAAAGVGRAYCAGT
jgi:hypothetical protein